MRFVYMRERVSCIWVCERERGYVRKRERERKRERVNMCKSGGYVPRKRERQNRYVRMIKTTMCIGFSEGGC